MQPYNFCISEVQLERLRKLAKRRDRKVSELIRRALDDFLETEL